MSEYTDELHAQIQRFDRIQESVDADDFAETVLFESPGSMHSHSFTATLVEDPDAGVLDPPKVEALADIDPTGTIASIDIRRREAGELVEQVPVEKGSGLWNAMEVWLEDIRTTWVEE